MTNEQIERLRALCDATDQGALRGDELRELMGLAREAAKKLDHLPIFCAFCGKTNGPDIILRPHMHCKFCDPIVSYKCGDSACECAK
jgi:hypothetical protein